LKAFVTGATGFVGSHVAELLQQEGAELRLLMRKGSRTENIDFLKADRIEGDLRDVESLRRGMSGSDVVFHVAADYRLWVRNPDEMYRANVDGTLAVMDAARMAGIKRVVYTSSVATMGFLCDGSIVDEESPVHLANMIGHYKRSKFMAEQAALAAGRAGAPVVLVNPTTPIGERDIKPTPTGRIILDFLNRKFPAYVDTGLNLADVKEVARGHLLAMEKAKPGERYILGGENLTLKQILDKLAVITGLSSPRLQVPLINFLRVSCSAKSRAPPLRQCAWDARRCLPLPRRPSASWDIARFPQKTRCVGHRHGSRSMGTFASRCRRRWEQLGDGAHRNHCGHVSRSASAGPQHEASAISA
jgi:dihydroflavonol-4-reductase